MCVVVPVEMVGAGVFVAVHVVVTNVVGVVDRVVCVRVCVCIRFFFQVLRW